MKDGKKNLETNVYNGFDTSKVAPGEQYSLDYAREILLDLTNLNILRPAGRNIADGQKCEYYVNQDDKRERAHEAAARATKGDASGSNEQKPNWQERSQPQQKRTRSFSI